jgi:hypothetical protein
MGVPGKAGVDDLPRNWGNGRTKERRGGCDVNATRDGPRGDLSGRKVSRRESLPAGEVTQGDTPARVPAFNQARGLSRLPISTCRRRPAERRCCRPIPALRGCASLCRASGAPVDEVFTSPTAWGVATVATKLAGSAAGGRRLRVRQFPSKFSLHPSRVRGEAQFLRAAGSQYSHSSSIRSQHLHVTTMRRIFPFSWITSISGVSRACAASDSRGSLVRPRVVVGVSAPGARSGWKPCAAGGAALRAVAPWEVCLEKKSVSIAEERLSLPEAGIVRTRRKKTAGHKKNRSFLGALPHARGAR